MARAVEQHTPTHWIDLDDVLEYLTLAPFGYEIDRALREMWQRISTGELRLKVETDVLDDKLQVVEGKLRSYEIDPFYFRANYTLEFRQQLVRVVPRGGLQIGRHDYTVAEQEVLALWPTPSKGRPTTSPRKQKETVEARLINIMTELHLKSGQRPSEVLKAVKKPYKDKWKDEPSQSAVTRAYAKYIKPTPSGAD